MKLRIDFKEDTMSEEEAERLFRRERNRAHRERKARRDRERQAGPVERPSRHAAAYIVHRAMVEPSLEWRRPEPEDCLYFEPLYK